MKCWTVVALIGCGIALGCSGPVVRDIPMLGPEDPHFEIERTYPVTSLLPS
jgi:hypothetical protein